MEIKRAIVSGATGAIGTALVKKLISENVEVLIVCRPNSQRRNNIPDNSLITVIFCEMTEYSTVENNTGKEYDVFYHFAWAGTTGTGRNDMYLQNSNVKYALDAVGMAKRFGCKKFVGAGSQAEYGRFEGMLKADTPTFPEMGYGYAKLCAGMMTRDYASQLGVEHNWVRILSVYGPNDGMQSMVMSTISKLKKCDVPECTKGEQKWDYLFSEDAAEAFFLVGKNGKNNKVYVLGSGEVKPLSEYIYDIRDAVNPSGNVNLGAIPYGQRQVMYLQADISELVKDTGFKPKYSFKEGIKKTVESFL